MEKFQRERTDLLSEKKTGIPRGMKISVGSGIWQGHGAPWQGRLELKYKGPCIQAQKFEFYTADNKEGREFLLYIKMA